MAARRPYSQFSAAELREIFRTRSDRATWRSLLQELSHRNTQAAKKLENDVRNALDGNPSSHGPSHDSNPPTPPRNTSNGSKAAGGPSPGRRARSAKAGFAPTAEQQRAVDAFLSGGSLKIAAFAGAGKTSTLRLMGEIRVGRGLYIAFNRGIADEAKSAFPRHIDCRTTHSLALGYVRGQHRLQNAKLFSSINARQLAQTLELRERNIDRGLRLEPHQQGFLLQATVRSFCQGADAVIGPEHLPIVGRLAGIKKEDRLEVDRWVIANARTLWERMKDPSDPIPLGHDGYLKLWGLARPSLPFDFILLDEAQDTNPVVLDVLQGQSAQMVYVGDRHQQIYEWRGAVNAMEKIHTDAETALTQSFRFGPQIAEAASSILSRLGERRALRGNPAVSSRIDLNDRPDAVLARTNATVIAETLHAISMGRKPFIVGGTDEYERLVGDVFNLMDGKPGSSPEFFGFSNWSEVLRHAGSEEGEDIRPFVTLVEQEGPKKLWAALKGSEKDPDRADVAISTAHKAKGGEWRSVKVANDFEGSSNDENAISQAEARLFYVTITRAKEGLSIEPQLLRAFTHGGALTRKTRPRRQSQIPSAPSSHSGSERSLSSGARSSRRESAAARSSQPKAAASTVSQPSPTVSKGQSRTERKQPASPVTLHPKLKGGSSTASPSLPKRKPSALQRVFKFLSGE